MPYTLEHLLLPVIERNKQLLDIWGIMQFTYFRDPNKSCTTYHISYKDGTSREVDIDDIQLFEYGDDIITLMALIHD